ncbi:unnamed protein product [Microthlaspi erraticum]|uniref:Uncharacterized protein n=1 Tax=Microthlaspi erraticum TaxID=1685480 RepID=A0A6D2J0G3_9BRAS|nr:unnamed protein product [Microthlaspi erraticum]
MLPHGLSRHKSCRLRSLHPSETRKIKCSKMDLHFAAQTILRRLEASLQQTTGAQSTRINHPPTSTDNRFTPNCPLSLSESRESLDTFSDFECGIELPRDHVASKDRRRMRDLAESRKPHAVAVKLCGETDEVLEILEDSEGKNMKFVSEVQERDGKLWFRSVFLLPFGFSIVGDLYD